MKSPVKVLILAAGLLVGVPMAAWTVTFLYWHFKIMGALHALEKRAGGRWISYIDHAEELKPIRASGCRSLPYVIHAMEDPAGGEFHWQFLYFLISSRASGDPDVVDQHRVGAFKALDTNRVEYDDPPETRLKKVRAIRAWWNAEGGHFHQGWRIWSSQCPGD